MLFFTIGAIGSGVFAGIEYLGAISGLIGTALIWALGNQADSKDLRSDSKNDELVSQSPKEPSQDESTQTRGNTIKKLIVGSLATYFVVVGSVNLLSGNYAGEELEQVAAVLVILLILWLIWISKKGDLKRAIKYNVPEVLQRKIATTGAKKLHESKVRYPYVEEVAADLRETARQFEDPLNEAFFGLGGIQIRRFTKSQNFLADAILRIGRKGFRVTYVNVNSKSGKERDITREWDETLGATEFPFEIYLKDHSSIEFLTLDEKTHLYLSAFWQVFQNAINGDFESLRDTDPSGLGRRLRDAADYLIENSDSVGPSANFDLNEVPVHAREEKLHVNVQAKFPEILDTIESWKLVEFIDNGSFGFVFKAKHIKTGKLSAIKIMSPKDLTDTDGPTYRRLSHMFLSEAPLSMKVVSPFIVSAEGYGEKPWPWIVYPLIQGVSLEEAWAEAQDKGEYWWNLAHDLTSALNVIHTEGMVHKDVKPGNMISQSNRFVLLDFGLGEVQGYGDLLYSGVSGTGGFIAPEILKAHEEKQDIVYSPSSDIYAAGKTLSFFVFDEESRKIVDQMVSLEPNDRPSAKALLRKIAAHVDLDEKMDLIRVSRDKVMATDLPVVDQNVEENLKTKIQGPIKSWAVLEAEIEKLVDVIRPRYFTISVVTTESEQAYVQAMWLGSSWVFEAMSENFTESPQSREQKTKFIRLGWTPPSNSAPNYTNFSDPLPTTEIVRLLVDAFESGFSVKLNSIKELKINIQGPGYY